jgi:hypothetical protein
MSGTLHFVDMNERCEYENGRQTERERERRKKNYNMYIQNERMKRKEVEKKLMFNIMPSLCSKVTSRRYHLLVCICYTFRMMAC